MVTFRFQKMIGFPGTSENIARGCESGQDDCYPFDFESNIDAPWSYCGEKNQINRAVFKICDCIPEMWETVQADDTIDIRMEILVDTGDGPEEGDNGVYWAEDLASDAIQGNLYDDQILACKDNKYTDMFYADGGWEYLLEDGTIGYPYTGMDSDCNSLSASNRVVEFRLDDEFGDHGYLVQPEDELEGNSSWAIDIPYMRVDPTRVSAGDKVWVRICLQLDCDGICSDDLECCCEIFIGELCCDTFGSENNDLILLYPYFPPANSSAFNLLGMTITNLSATDGEATIQMFESDADGEATERGEITVVVPGNGIYLQTIGALASGMTKMAGAGDLGDEKSYLVVTTNFSGTGFAMIANTVDGASMGYLPLPSWLTWTGTPGYYYDYEPTP